MTDGTKLIFPCFLSGCELDETSRDANSQHRANVQRFRSTLAALIKRTETTEVEKGQNLPDRYLQEKLQVIKMFDEDAGRHVGM